MEEVSQLKKRLTTFFGPAVRAISDKYDYDFPAVFTVQEIDEVTAIVLWPSPEKDFRIFPDSIEEGDGIWNIKSSSGLWQLRIMPEAKAYADSFKKAQYYRG